MIKRLLILALKNPVSALILSGILIRIFIISLYQHITIFPDSEGYIELADLLANNQLSGYNGQRSPGYPLLLVLAGNSLSLTVLLQFILGIFSCILVYRNVLLLKFSPEKSFFIALFLNSILHVLFYETAILTESLTFFVITLIFYIYLKYFFENCSLKMMFLLSFLFGFLVLIKPFYFFLPFLFYAFSVLKGFTPRRIINKRIVILIFPLMCFFGWSYVNKINTGYFVPTTFYGINIAQNCVHFAEKTPDKYKTIRDIYVKHREIAKKENKDVSMSIWYAYDELIATTGLSFVDLSYQLNEFSKEAIRDNPKEYCYQVLVSWADFWKVDMYWNYRDFKVPYSNKFFIGIWYIQSTVLQFLKIAFILLIPVQLYNFLRNRKITHELVITLIILCTSILQAIVTYGTNARFSYPFEFLMVLVVFLYFEKKKFKIKAG